MRYISLIHKIKAYLFLCLPLHLVSSFIFFLTRIESRWLPYFINAYIRFFEVDMSLSEKPNPADYKTFNEFFIRKLKPELRPVSKDPATLISPCDGTILQYGDIEAGTMLQAKGMTYTVKELFGQANDCAAHFSQGKYMTIYLAPKDYHRVHMPATGQLQTLIHNPGRLISVAPYTLKFIRSLYAQNERVILQFETKLGTLALIMVGAVNVGSISVRKIGLITPRRHAAQRFDYAPTRNSTRKHSPTKRGEEVANFNMGSTVILLTSNQKLSWGAECFTEKKVLMGQEIARN